MSCRCKVFRDATAAREVGRCMAVHKEWRLHWWDTTRFLSVLRRCAASGNSAASYIIGLDEICNRRRKESGLQHLRHAMEHGLYAVAAYTIGMVMLRDSRSLDSVEQAMEYLEEAGAALSGSAASTTSSKMKISCVRREAASVIRRLTMHRWKTVVEPTGPTCTDPQCGEMETMTEGWDEADDEQRRFCSRICRWKHEYCKFVRWI